MENNLFQNIDTPQDNPLETISTTDQPAATPVKSAFSLKDPKIIALVILGAVFVVLLILAAVVTIVRGSPKKIVKTPSTKPTITQAPIKPDSVVPTQFAQRFSDLDKSLQTNEDYLPPQIDVQIGL